MTPHLLVLASYSAVLIGVGWFVSRRARSAEAFFVAGRRLPAGLIFATVLAANIGAGSTIGAAALGFEHGLAAFFWVGAAGLGTLLLAVWLGPRMWRAASAERLRTVGDFLERRYGVGARAALTGLLLVATLFVLAAQLLAAGVLVESVTALPFPAAVAAATAVMTAYFAVGGLQSAASVNLVQLGVLLGGLALAVPFALRAAGGAAGLREALGPAATDLFSSGSLALGYTALLVPAFLVSPGILQKLFGARSENAVRRGLLAAGVALLAFAAVPPLLGASAAALHPALARPDAALPTLLVESLPLWLGCLGVAALFSAEVSSADAVLFMLSTSLSRDFYQRFLRPEADDAAVLAAARRSAVGAGALGALLAIVAGSVIESLTVFYSLLGVSLFVPVLAGLHRFRPSGRAILLGAAAGVSAFLVVFAFREVPPAAPPLTGIGVSALVVALSSFLGRRRGG